jgi:hypothetical protein
LLSPFSLQTSARKRRHGGEGVVVATNPVLELLVRQSGASRFAGWAREGWMIVVKLLRAHGGCLGVRRLRRAWKTAKSSGELSNER